MKYLAFQYLLLKLGIRDRSLGRGNRTVVYEGSTFSVPVGNVTIYCIVARIRFSTDKPYAGRYIRSNTYH